jgi:nicotinate phosphoribosyltransferase
MVDAALRSGIAHHRAVFELWTRSLPRGRRYGVVAGTARVVEAITRFRFRDPELGFLAAHRIVSPTALDWLADFRFSGDVEGYTEGELHFPASPVLTVEGSFAEAVVLETLLLSILNHDSAIASAAARMVVAAGGRPTIEMGSRRTHEESAVASARAAYLAGFASTSNLEAGRRYGVPTAGTVAHAFIMAHPDEFAAFVAQIAAQGVTTTILVDTYDIDQGVRNAVRAANAFGAPGPAAIRIDAGDLVAGCRRARALLDELGASDTQIIATGDLDEYRIEVLEQVPGGRAPVDAYGVGTGVVTGSGHPTAGFIYKLVAIADSPDPGAPLRPVHKTQIGKATHGGRKSAYRVLDPSGRAVAEVLGAPPATGGGHPRPLQVPLIRRGEPLPLPSLSGSREFHSTVRAELPPDALELGPGRPAMHAASIMPAD